jgi:NAD(P)-dependent dehydrogenase (short-subunit alcohol dehydrogenase family)
MKTVLITGVSRKEGLGYETARQMAENGFDVVLTARDGAKAQALAENLAASTGAVIKGFSLDVTNSESVAAAVKTFSKYYQKLNVLINNGALMMENQASIQNKDIAELSAEIETNFTGTWRVTQAFIPFLKESGNGNIVNISSSMGSITEPLWGLLDYTRGPIPAYSLTKLALNGLTIKMAKDLKADNVIVNSVCPGFTATRPGLAEMGARPVEESVQGIVWAAALPPDGPTGSFFRDKQIVTW